MLDVSHQQMEQYRDQPAHAEKIAYQQKLLQEDVVHIRAEISQVSTVRDKLHSQVFCAYNGICSVFDVFLKINGFNLCLDGVHYYMQVIVTT